MTTAHAEFILSPDSVIANTLGMNSAGNVPTNMIDQSGLSAGFTSGISGFDAYLSGSPTHICCSATTWFSSDPPPGTVDFDLGNTFLLERLVLWNRGAGFGTNLNEFEVFTSSSPDFSTSTSVGTFAASNVGDPSPPQVFDITDSSARYVRLSITSNHGGSPNIVGIGEIAFDASVAGAQSEFVQESCDQVIGTLNFHWEGLAGPATPCSGIEFTNLTIEDAADGSVTFNGTSVSNDVCLFADSYAFTLSNDGLTLTGGTTGEVEVPMTLTRAPDEPCFVGHWIDGGADYLAHLSAHALRLPEATLAHQWLLEGSTADTFGGPSLVLPDESTLGEHGLTLVGSGRDDGPSVSGAFVDPAVWSIELLVTLFHDDVGYQKLIDFADLVNDQGMYVYCDYLYFYDTGPDIYLPIFTAGQPMQVVLTRDSTGTVVAYLNGELGWAFDDGADGYAVFSAENNIAHFLRDDSSSETDDAFLDSVRIWNGALTPSEVSTLYVPEPSAAPLGLGALLTLAVVRIARKKSAS